ncbi:FapA family protein [Sporosarcina sp. GW1-11]|uniref:flagellar assembly protein A n=1 Tax=Sporosarcina sp. GW1-11 TaxID=2899126 RepID=UPI00294FB4A6|nr:flagellar assembly protein A [Sporosarcina sp. GW1-11]MDV6377528.1 FapA family protein [Sporosarcina sp. GW1-11]
MTRSITVQAESVEKALEQALSVLKLTIDEVHVRIDRPASTSMFGLKKVLAEVTVTQVLEVLEDVEVQKSLSSVARIYNGQLDVRFEEQSYPIILPASGVELRINGEVIQQRTILLPTDTIVCQAITENIPALFVIQLDKEHMIAIATVTPGMHITRALVDTSWQEILNIQVTEKIQMTNDLSTQDFVEELLEMGIEHGLSMDGIQQATETLVRKEFIIARGTPMIDSQDATLKIPESNKKELVDDHERVDFREHSPVPTVKAGQLIATYIPPVRGEMGINLFGDSLPVKPPKEFILRPGSKVNCFQNKIYAKIDGRPMIERRGKLVKVDVNPEFRHMTDVDLECGNIHFEGDVWIGGSVHSSMFVAAAGNIEIMKNCTKASIRGTKSVIVKGSIFSSTVTVGIQEKIIALLVEDLKEILTYLKNIESALGQIFTLREEKAEEVPPFILKQAIHLLLDQKYGDFLDLIKQFIQVVKNHSRRVEKEWLELSDSFYLLFVDPLREEQATVVSLRKLINKTDLLLEVYSEEVRPESLLQAAFALNSILYSNGNIQIRSKGVYNCSITALNDIIIKGVCRGGEVIAGRHIEMDETGSAAGVKTKIQTTDGVIRIGKAYPGTIIQIGELRHEFFTITQDVIARINEKGILVFN